MKSLYLYLDETYIKSDDYWHCNIGGAILPASKIYDAELELENCLYAIYQRDNSFPFQEEFKYSRFFSSARDELKMEACSALVSTACNLEIDFLVSHAKIATRKISPLSAFCSPQKAIQFLANFNISHYLTEPAKNHLIQTVVDLGLSGSFKSVYDMYYAISRGLKLVKSQGFEDDLISVPNYRNLLPPVFITSQDSRLLQLSDLIIGLLLSRDTGKMSPFKESLLNSLTPIQNRIKLNSVKWNKDDANYFIERLPNLPHQSGTAHVKH